MKNSITLFLMIGFGFQLAAIACMSVAADSRITHTSSLNRQTNTVFGASKSGLSVALTGPQSISAIRISDAEFMIHIRNTSDKPISYFEHGDWNRAKLTDDKGHEFQDFKDYRPEVNMRILSYEDIITILPGHEKIINVYIAPLRRKIQPGFYHVRGIIINPPNDEIIRLKNNSHAKNLHFWTANELETPAITLQIR